MKMLLLVFMIGGFFTSCNSGNEGSASIYADSLRIADSTKLVDSLNMVNEANASMDTLQTIVADTTNR